MDHTNQQIRYVAWHFDHITKASTWWPGEDRMRSTFEEAEADAKKAAERNPGTVWMVVAVLASVSTSLAPAATTRFSAAEAKTDSDDHEQ